MAKSRKIKDKILKPDNSIDARTLCEIIDSMSSTEKYDKRLKEVWEYLRPKVTKKVSYIILNSHPEVKEKVFGYIDKLKQDNIYVLKKGELEDYILEGLEIIEDLGLANQKELKVIKIAELINSEEIGIEQVLDVGDYMDVIKRL